MRESSPVTHGKVNAVPSGIKPTASASTPSESANGNRHSPDASSTMPSRDSRASPEPVEQPAQQQHAREHRDPHLVHEEPVDGPLRDLEALDQEQAQHRSFALERADGDA
jgi:hypothetical protein